MATTVRTKLEERVVKAAEGALVDRHFVTAIDVLVGIGWLTTPQVDQWRQGRVDYLERQITANLSKISIAMAAFRHWAQKEAGLNPSETAYLSRSRDHRPLRFSKSGDPGIEAAYRTHWVSPELSEAKKARLAEDQGRAPDLVVISPLKEWICTECAGTGGDLLFMEGDGPLCLVCADLDQLVFLSAGDAPLTRRAKKASGLAAVVVRFSRSRGRYERQGILVEEEALAQAEASCLADEETRARRRLPRRRTQIGRGQLLQGISGQRDHEPLSGLSTGEGRGHRGPCRHSGEWTRGPQCGWPGTRPRRRDACRRGLDTS